MGYLNDSDRRLLFKGLRDNQCMGPWTECPDYEAAFDTYVQTLPETQLAKDQIDSFVEFCAATHRRAGGILANIIQKIIAALIAQVKPTKDSRTIDWTALFQKMVTLLIDQIKPKDSAVDPKPKPSPKPKPKPSPTPTPTPPPGV